LTKGTGNKIQFLFAKKKRTMNPTKIEYTEKVLYPSNGFSKVYWQRMDEYPQKYQQIFY